MTDTSTTPVIAQPNFRPDTYDVGPRRVHGSGTAVMIRNSFRATHGVEYEITHVPVDKVVLPYDEILTTPVADLRVLGVGFGAPYGESYGAPSNSITPVCNGTVVETPAQSGERATLEVSPIGDVRKVASKRGFKAATGVDPYKGGWTKTQLIDWIVGTPA